MRRAFIALSIVAGSMVLGCQNSNAVLIPSSDSSLNKTAATFASEAKAYFPYPKEAARGTDIDARAEIGYMWNVINLVNYSGEDWDNVEIWINKQYVLPIAKMESGKTKRVSFKLFYNDAGTYFPLGGTMINSLEIKRDGSMYTIPCQIGG